MATEPSSTTAVDSQGDVMLKLTKNESTTKLLVSSKTLTLASIVFKAMFNGKFAEGQGLSTATPPEVELPDDDPVLMEMLCNITHLRASHILEDLSLSNLADFAILCDKYACVGAVYPWVKLWVQKPLSKPKQPDYEKLVLITYLMDLPQEFFTATQCLVRDRAACIDPEVAAHGHEFLPAKLLYGLVQSHTLCQNKAIRAVNISEFTLDGKCEEGVKISGRYLNAIRQANLWSSKSMSIRQLRNQANLMQEVTSQSNSNCYLDCICRHRQDLKRTVVERMNKVYDEAKGLCMDCIMRPEGMPAGQCRVQHT